MLLRRCEFVNFIRGTGILIRKLSTNAPSKHFKILVAGGGAGGSSIANALGRKLGADNVGVVEPQEVSLTSIS